ncbi:MAG: DNA-binding domain-containing protein [Steroidobacteraceae bacterium]
MRSPPDARGLVALESAFAAALDRHERYGAAAAALFCDDGIPAVDRLQYYRNNVGAIFEEALARTFPVLRRRVSEGHFATLAREYRAAHPSRSGDLHWVGREFPAWLEQRYAGSDYSWLADLAHLEWACEEALVADWRPPVGPEALAAIAPDDLAQVRLAMQPSLRLVASEHPIWSVWRANQPDAPGEPVDPALGAESVVVTQVPDGIELHSVPPAQYQLIAALAAGETLIGALEASGVTADELEPTLRFVFEAGLVTGVIAPAVAPEQAKG